MLGDKFCIKNNVYTQNLQRMECREFYASGVVFGSDPVFARNTRVVNLTNCDIQYMPVCIGFKHVNLVGNPLREVAFNRGMRSIRVPATCVQDEQPSRTVPSLLLECLETLAHDHGADTLPDYICDMLKLARCSFCEHDEYCMQRQAYRFLTYNCCVRCARLGLTPYFTVTICDGYALLVAPKICFKVTGDLSVCVPMCLHGALNTFKHHIESQCRNSLDFTYGIVLSIVAPASTLATTGIRPDTKLTAHIDHTKKIVTVSIATS